MAERMPVKRFSAGGVQAAIWENDGKNGGTFFTVSLQRSYKDAAEGWKRTASMRAQDLPRAVLVLQKAYEFLALKENRPAEEAELAPVVE